MSTQSKFLRQSAGSSRLHWLVVTVIFSIVTFLLSPNGPLGGFWGGQVERTMPGGVQRFLFILLGAIQSIAFGLGIAFLLFGFSSTSTRTPVNRGLARITQLAIAWSLISWWPHSNFHQTLSPDNSGGLLAIEYGFHVTLILAGLILAYFFIKTLQPE